MQDQLVEVKPIGRRKALAETAESARKLPIVWKSRLTEQDGDNVWRNVIEIEKRFGKRSMGVLEVIHEDDGEDSEVTKVEAGVKTVLHWNLEQGSILSGALIFAFPTDGDESDEIIPYLAYGKQLSDRATFQSTTQTKARSSSPGSCRADTSRSISASRYR